MTAPPHDPPGRVRLADLAASAGVSTATVSRVLNRRPGVSESARQAVYHALDMLGYDRPARVPTPTQGLVGLIVPELSNPVFPAFAQSIESTLAHYGYTPLLCTQTTSGLTEDEYVDLLLASGVTGIVFVNGMHADTEAPLTRYHRLAERGVPYVLVNGPREELAAPAVAANERLGMDLAVAHLVMLGHKRIALAVGPERLVPSRQKREGFAAAVRRHIGPEAAHRVLVSLYTVEGGEASAMALLSEGVTAIICGNDLMALGAMRAARSLGLRVPTDLSVVGFDDSLFMQFTDPPLTTLRQPVAKMSTAAVELLRSSMTGPNLAQRGAASSRGTGGAVGTHRELLFAPELIVRGSTATVRTRA